MLPAIRSEFVRDTLATVIVVYPDTNAFFADYLMGREVSEAFLDVLARGSIEVWVSPVVVAEADRQTRENATKLVSEVKGALGNVRRSFALDEESAVAFTKSLSNGLTAQGAKALEPMLKHTACKIIPWSTVSAKTLVQRELERRKPVLETGSGQSLGLRDVVIWHDFMEALGRLDYEDYVVFVSNDKGFAEGGVFHKSLLNEIEALGTVPIENVKLVLTLGEATLEVRRFAKLVTDREERLIDALVDWVYGLDGFDWEGFPTSNEVVLDSTLPEGMREVNLTVVPMLNIFEVGEGNPARCIASNELIFRGWMSSFDFMEATDDRLSILDRTLKPSEVAVEFRVEAEIKAEIEYELDGRSAKITNATVSWDV